MYLGDTISRLLVVGVASPSAHFRVSCRSEATSGECYSRRCCSLYLLHLEFIRGIHDLDAHIARFNPDRGARVDAADREAST
jgi:hypothetical protein